MREITSIEINHEAQVGNARRAVHDFASRIGFSETELAEIDIVVQEIGTNAATYANGGGWLHFTEPPGKDPGLELFYWDTGPGIYNMDRAIRDGVSTSGSLGAGLGAIRRLTDEFDIYSTMPITGRLSLAQQRRTSHGTALLARKWVAQGAADTPDREEARRFGIWTQPHPGETVNGDAYCIKQRKERTLLSVIDGLGHGEGAKEAAFVALDVLDDWMGERPDELLRVAHDALRSTRGAVMGVVVLDHSAETFQYAGVGNIAVRVFGAAEHIAPISANGTLGLRMGTSLRLWTYPWTEGATVLMASDGLSESWDIQSYPGLLKRSPQMLAGILMRDYGRDADDATVLVAR